MRRSLTRFLALVVLLLASGFTTSANAEAPAMAFPDHADFQLIVETGIGGNHPEALRLATAYAQKHASHPCGPFAVGMVEEWTAIAQIPQPYLFPTIEAFEKAGRLDDKDAAASLCRGAAHVRLSRIYFKYGQYLMSVRRAVSGGKQLEKLQEKYPEAYDIYTFVGPYHYFADKTPAPARAFLRVFGLRGDRVKGLQELEVAAEKAGVFHAEAGQVLYTLQSKFEGNAGKYEYLIDGLIEKYPQNVIFRRNKDAVQALLASSR